MPVDFILFILLVDMERGGKMRTPPEQLPAFVGNPSINSHSSPCPFGPDILEPFHVYLLQ